MRSHFDICPKKKYPWLKKYPTLEETGVVREAKFNRIDDRSIVYDLSNAREIDSKGRGYASCRFLLIDELNDWKGVDCSAMNCWSENEECDRVIKLKSVHIYHPDRTKKIAVTYHDRENISHIKKGI